MNGPMAVPTPLSPALERPSRDQRLEDGGYPAQDGGHGEPGDPGQEDPPVAILAG